MSARVASTVRVIASARASATISSAVSTAARTGVAHRIEEAGGRRPVVAEEARAERWRGLWLGLQQGAHRRTPSVDVVGAQAGSEALAIFRAERRVVDGLRLRPGRVRREEE